MKNILKFSLLIVLVIQTICSCKKDENKVFATPPASINSFEASNLATPVFSLATKDDLATTFSWAPTSYQVATPVTYTLQYDSLGKGFTSPLEVSVGSGSVSSLAATQAMLNTYAIECGVTAGNKASLEFRIKTAVGTNNSLPVYSTPITLTYTTYDQIIFWYVPGDYQGWNPGNAPKIGSREGVNYEGYIWVPTGGTGEFKINIASDWDHANYGGISTPTGGTLDAAAGNLKWPATGAYYLLQVNATAKTWAVTKTVWSVIGSGTPGAWDADTPMTFDASTGKWKVTLAATDGEFKFRANNSWDLSLGSGTDGFLTTNNGGNLPITAGTKTITLDLTNPLKYNYTVQ